MKYTYSISFWFNVLNSQVIIDSETLVNFGNIPVINYQPSDNTIKISFNVQQSQSESVASIYITDIKLQKWNFVVVNVDGGAVDVFLDAVLVQSKSNIIPYFDKGQQDISVGSNTALQKQITTEVCNFVYFPRELTILEITSLYNESKGKNPPISEKVEVADKLSEYVTYLTDAEMKFHQVKKLFECSYTPFVPDPVKVSSALADDNPFSDFMSLPWYFQHFGDNITGY